MYKFINVNMCACIIYVCVHVQMYRGKNPHACMYVGKHTQVYSCLYISIYVERHTSLCIHVCMHMYIYIYIYTKTHAYRM